MEEAVNIADKIAEAPVNSFGLLNGFLAESFNNAFAEQFEQEQIKLVVNGFDPVGEKELLTFIESQKPEFNAWQMNAGKTETTLNNCSIGIDIVEFNYLKELMKDENPKFLKRIFSPLEIRISKSQPKSSELFAANFAAKEAYLKAIGTGWSERIRWHDIEFALSGAGRPHINLYRIARQIALEEKIKGIIVFLLRDTEKVIALVILDKY